MRPRKDPESIRACYRSGSWPAESIAGILRMDLAAVQEIVAGVEIEPNRDAASVPGGCKTPGCTGKHFARGWCKRCYNRGYARRLRIRGDSIERSMIRAQLRRLRRDRRNYYGPIDGAVKLQREIEAAELALAETR